MKFKTIALALAVAGTTSLAQAADAIIYEPAVQPVQDYAPQAFDWSGGYIGLQGGYAWAPLANPFGSDQDLDGGTLGAYGGFNIQSGSLVYGVEGDVNYNWNEKTSLPWASKAGVDWDGAVRGRLGYAFDRTLVYGTAGLALARGYVETAGVEHTETLVGWTIGAGVEHAFTDNVVARADYRYADYEGKDFGLGAGKLNLDQHTVRVGLSYKF